MANKGFVLNLDHNQDNLGASLGITPERSDELEQMFKDSLKELMEDDNDSLSLSSVLEKVAMLDTTVEEYTFMVLQLGHNM